MPAVDEYSDDDPLFDPDELQVPESPEHRGATDLVAVMAAELLGPSSRVYRDMNWYPLDGGNAVAPDVMILPAEVLPKGAKSYKQESAAGPDPSVVVEIPSDTDTFSSLLGKLERYARLGVVAYVVRSEGGSISVMKYSPDGQLVLWGNEPIPELGELALDTSGPQLVAIRPDGQTFRSDHEWFHQLQQQAEAEALRAEIEAKRAEAEAQRADTQTARADTGERRAAALAEQLRAMGVEPVA